MKSESQRLRRNVALVAALLTTAAACSDDASDRNASLEEIDVTDFGAFAGFPIPDNADVMGTNSTRGIDTLSSLVFSVPSDAIPAMLEDARFVEPLADGVEPSNDPGIDAIDLTDRPIASAQDRVEVDGRFVTREVTVVDHGERSTVAVVAFTQ